MEPFTLLKCIDELNDLKSNKILQVENSKQEILCNKENLVDIVTANFDKNCIVICDSLSTISENIETLKKRPSFIHLHIEIPLSFMMKKEKIASDKVFDFIQLKEENFKNYSSIYKNPSIKISLQSNNHTVLDKTAEISYIKQLLEIPIFKHTTLSTKQGISSPQRPSWDEYFMQLANLASTRSNCMKRKVGCCIVSKNKVVATGYNGTPRNLTNCFSGGCKRCNIGSMNLNGNGAVKNVHTLGTCFCLHAEENALLEAGNIRIDSDCVLYCDTCPCITCSVKIVQAGIGEVVYSQSYNMDSESFAIFEEAGIKIRQFDHGGIKKDYNFEL
ncbi:hypothetical protein HANVADRAFT_24366 [Hanseniaspora valbyensis NRRL Y-1626]|uniref:Deoxycytidylate deaminase n=1 Tax=Hanseniaspora valbyensis NRRL Y-1626 TaxID=766949 RepID=A0A1B7TDT7_9ASCO|nr:hypothetical protein HANVADRAFT_24366 [Hanseniaspora valbyensis NRRL Y-1626]